MHVGRRTRPKEGSPLSTCFLRSIAEPGSSLQKVAVHNKLRNPCLISTQSTSTCRNASKTNGARRSPPPRLPLGCRKPNFCPTAGTERPSAACCAPAELRARKGARIRKGALGGSGGWQDPATPMRFSGARNQIQRYLPIDRSLFGPDWPIRHGRSEFLEALGKTVATFGYLEDILAGACHCLAAGTERFGPEPTDIDEGHFRR